MPKELGQFCTGPGRQMSEMSWGWQEDRVSAGEGGGKGWGRRWGRRWGFIQSKKQWNITGCGRGGVCCL